MSTTAEIVAHLKRKSHTYAEMMLCCGHIVSTSPHKRVLDWLETAEGQRWELRKGRVWMGESRYLTTWRVVRRKGAA